MIPSLISAALYLAGPALGPATWCQASLYDWIRDGSSVVWKVALCDESGGPKFLMVTDDAGRPTHLFRDGWFDLGDAPEVDAQPPRGMEPRKMPWLEGAARAERDYDDWAKGHASLPGDPVKPQWTPRDKEHGAGKDRVQFRTQSTGEGCPPLTLQLALDHGFIDVFQDRCLPGEPNHRRAEGTVTMAWSPDGKRLAVAWEVDRQTKNGEAGGVPEGLLTRGYVAVVPRAALEGKEPFRTVKRVLCPVDVLDARSGKGPGLETLAGKLTSAGFTVGHTGKAGTQRTATEVYYAPGFAPEAREAAALAGVKPDEVEDAVKPLTWKSAYPVTIAVGAPR